MIQPQLNQTSNCSVARCSKPGFTVIELLVVISIIVLVLAMAVPAFNAITGNKSEAAMFNQISAMLARARTEAVGVQQLRGVMFYFDPADATTKLALVRQVDPPYAPNAIPPVFPMDNIDVYLDLTGDRDVLTLPAGVGVQTIGEYANASGNPRYDAYIGFNVKNAHPGSIRNDTYVRYGGVILFDGRGQLVSKSYALQTHRLNTSTNSDQYTAMGLMLFGGAVQPADTPDAAHDDVVAVDPTLVFGGRGVYLRSQIGLAIFQQEPYASVAFEDAQGNGDAQVSSPNSMPVGEAGEEAWLDDNAQMMLVNRYNGTLMKGE